MEYTRLGNSGLKVSRIALGCMSFGDPDRGFSEWSLREEQAGPFFAQAVELGITFWDTANVYNYGSLEEIVGRAIKTYSRREDVVLATKLHLKMHDARAVGLFGKSVSIAVTQASMQSASLSKPSAKRGGCSNGSQDWRPDLPRSGG